LGLGYRIKDFFPLFYPFFLTITNDLSACFNINNSDQFKQQGVNQMYKSITNQSNDSKIITIGRDVNNDICINKPQVSSFHAKFIIKSSDKIILQDLNSTNGTYINDKKISSSEIIISDCIKFGSFHFDMKLLEDKLYELEEDKLYEQEYESEYSLQTNDHQEADYQTDKQTSPKMVNIKVILSIILIIAGASYAYNKNIGNIQQYFTTQPQAASIKHTNSINKPIAQTTQSSVKNKSSSNQPIQKKTTQKPFQINQQQTNQQMISNLSETYPLISEKNGFIQCGETLQGRINSPGYVEKIKFNAQSGEKIGIAVSRLNDNTHFYPCWKLISPSSQIIKVGYRELICKGNQEYILPHSGQYTIEINDNRQRYTGDYAIRLEPVSSTINGITSPAPKIECNLSQKGEIKLKNAADSYSFSGKCGEKIAIAVTKKSFSALFHPCWQLVDPSGNIIKYGYEYSVCSGNTSYILPFNGLYTIRVFDQDYDGTGDYNVRLEPISVLLNGEQSCARQLSPGKTLTDNIEESNASCAFIFNKQRAKASIRVKKKSTSASFKPCWSLHNASGEIIPYGYKDYVCSGKPSYILKSDGPFLIRVWDDEHNSPGKFSIFLN